MFKFDTFVSASQIWPNAEDHIDNRYKEEVEA